MPVSGVFAEPPPYDLRTMLGRLFASEGAGSSDKPLDLAKFAAFAAVVNARLDERALLDGNFTGSVDNVTPVAPFVAANVNLKSTDFVGTPQATTMLVTLAPASGEGRYRVGGGVPTSADGLSIPAGGGMFTVSGLFNIQSFTMIAVGATPLLYSCQIFARASYSGGR
jgi:hypothetical protein